MGKEKHKEFIVYRIYHIESGKSYIGITVDYKRRMREHFNCHGNCSYLYNSIHKHGKENFTNEIIYHCNCWKGLQKKEIEFIKRFNTKIPNGYNLTDGGDGSFGFRHTKETCKKMSDIQRKLSSDQIIKIKQRLFKRETHQKIANDFKIDIALISRIRNEKAYADIQLPDIDWNTLPKRNRKFSTEQIIKIKKMLFDGYSSSNIAKQFNVVQPVISEIKTGKKYAEINCPGVYLDDLPKGCHKLNTKQVLEIKQLLLNGIPQRKIARQFKVGRTLIGNINLGKHYSDIQLLREII